MKKNYLSPSTANRFSIRVFSFLLAGTLLMACQTSRGQASLTPSGYSQNFDSLGTGTNLGSLDNGGWSQISVAGDHEDWEDSIPAGGGDPSAASSGNVNNTLIVVTNSFTSSTKNETQGYNFSDTATANRCIGTSPTGDAGNIFQLIIVNNTGYSLMGVNISYDIRRLFNGTGQGSPPYIEELPGYELFYSTDGGLTYTNVPALNPTQTTCPDSVGVTNESGAITFGSVVGIGASIYFRWVDDNAITLSPDQIIGLDNVSITGLPFSSISSLSGDGQFLSFAPNPFLNETKITYSGIDESHPLLLSIYNVLGEKIFSENVASEKKQIMLDESVFKNQSGIFFVELATDEKTIRGKLVRTK